MIPLFPEQGHERSDPLGIGLQANPPGPSISLSCCGAIALSRGPRRLRGTPRYPDGSVIWFHHRNQRPKQPATGHGMTTGRYQDRPSVVRDLAGEWHPVFLVTTVHLQVHHGRPVRTAGTQVSLHSLSKFPKSPRMVALIDQVRNDHVKGQLETLQSRSGTL
eukprot:3917260-Rhodomonas_salina.1